MKKSPLPSAYTLAEILVAAGILILVVAVMASVSLSLSNQEEQSARTAVFLNYHEQTGRLWQLGLTPAEIEAIRPPTPDVIALVFNEDDASFAGIGTLRRATSNIVFRSAGTLDTTNPALRTNSTVLLRPIP
jgi:type II secretory pathway pseudopilin PulG